MTLFKDHDFAGRQHRDSLRQLFDRVWRVRRYNEGRVRLGCHFFGDLVGHEVVAECRIHITNGAWHEASEAHAVNNTLTVFEDAHAHT